MDPRVFRPTAPRGSLQECVLRGGDYRRSQSAVQRNRIGPPSGAEPCVGTGQGYDAVLAFPLRSRSSLNLSSRSSSSR
jgi:hypothetical protein